MLSLVTSWFRGYLINRQTTPTNSGMACLETYARIYYWVNIHFLYLIKFSKSDHWRTTSATHWATVLPPTTGQYPWSTINAQLSQKSKSKILTDLILRWTLKNQPDIKAYHTRFSSPIVEQRGGIGHTFFLTMLWA